MNVFLHYQFWIGFTIGLFVITSLSFRIRKFYKKAFNNMFVVLATLCIGVLFIIPAVIGFSIHLVKTGYQRGYEAYDDFIEWMRIID